MTERTSRGWQPAVLIALLLAGAFLGACLGQLAAWSRTVPLPAGEELRSIGEAIVGTAPQWVERDDHLFGYPDRYTDSGSLLVALAGGEDYGPGEASLVYPVGPATAGFAGLAAGWTARAREAGWQPREVRADGTRPMFTAARAGLLLDLTVTDAAQTTLRVRREPPAGTGWWMAGGALLGIALAWPAGRSCGRRLARSGPAVRVVAAAGLLVSGVLLLPGSLLTVAGVLPYVLDGHPEQPLWSAFMLPLVRLATHLSLVAVLAAVVAGWWGGRARR